MLMLDHKGLLNVAASCLCSLFLSGVFRIDQYESCVMEKRFDQRLLRMTYVLKKAQGPILSVLNSLLLWKASLAKGDLGKLY